MSRAAWIREQGGGLAAWSIQHPVGVVMMTLALIVLGLFSLTRLGIDLLPQLIYPEVRVRVSDPGVPARIMEDRITRQLEEQLAITEDAIAVQSRSSEGSSAVDLSFPYGKDIDTALRDASTRLDRARRFLPTTIEPPRIFKSDPSQIPIAEFVISSTLRDPVALREYADYRFSQWFLNLPGVASLEVGGGLAREIQILPDQRRLAGLGLAVDDLIEALQTNNQDVPGGRLMLSEREIVGRTAGRFERFEQIAWLPLATPGGSTVRLNEVAEVIDGHQEQRLMIRLDGVPGVKVSVQKQPRANTVAVVEAVSARLAWLRDQGLIPPDIQVRKVGDQSVYVKNALDNALKAGLSGAVLAMLVVYVFLGDLRRTLIVGSAIPIAIVVTLILMALGGLTLNIMTLGGLALGIGMLVDSAIVMMENIYRHQQRGEGTLAPVAAAAEVNSALVASTSTNLAAVLPFLFIGGLLGLLFKELIFTLSAAIVAALVVALTLVPALAARAAPGPGAGRLMERLMGTLRAAYERLLARLLRRPIWVILIFVAALAAALPVFFQGKQIFLPELDEGRIGISVRSDPGMRLAEMDAAVQRLERLVREQPEVDTVFTIVGGFIFGRSSFESSSRASIQVQLRPGHGSGRWIKRMNDLIDQQGLAGFKVGMRSRGIRGIRLGSGDDDLSVRVQGPELETLARIGDGIVERLRTVPGLDNIEHTYDNLNQELALEVDRERAAALGMSVEDVGSALRLALEGRVVTDFLDGDRRIDVRLRLPRAAVDTLAELENLVIGGGDTPLRLGDIVRVNLATSPSRILRDNQLRINEISASLEEGAALGEVLGRVRAALADYELPEAYVLYEGGAGETLRESRRTGWLLLALALFLVLVVMAVQYESLRNPLIIMVSVPFAAVGVALAVYLLDLPLSVPLWLGVIMLAGIVVNNAIVLVETVELQRASGLPLPEAVRTAAGIRLRPILMTTLTTVFGMLPLALGIGQGAEMLAPMAVAIVSGLSFSVLVSLILVPAVYRLVGGELNPEVPLPSP